ncbi:hypothetical protein PILCRDRAFT_306245 [Piloderma croceum F 1598]|uniref:HMG box domain-containing protein n=1 Tax=Piloderma croceum (strain F 1598) TaxID=765440 RepID=A0A0C3BJI4_PILCF|nr:hypothetical protein PILCRDRAFT_306245 [Piloderma croceum F 1598]
MSNYPLEYSLQHVATGGVGAFHESLTPGRRDERDSQTPSDDGSCFFHHSKSENDFEEDPNTSLIAQTLNTDGTPKRPMNAFMIFARRRRPQVSAENQTMRTGEISKILSKEWNAMELTDKQFYLDQAKQLKDIFNSKYPDYVYRRRPNNSRRRRGPGPSGSRALDPSLAHEMEGDESGHPEFDDISAIDGEDLLADVVSTDLRYSHIPADMPAAYGMHLRASSYKYPPSDTSYRPSHGRAPYPASAQQRQTADISIEPPHFSQSLGSNHNYQQSNLQAQQSQSQSSALYVPDATWDSAGVPRDDQVRTTSASWLGGQDRLVANHTHDRSHTFSPGSNQSSWGRATSPAPLRSTSASSPNYTFPTLNSPFYPNQSQVAGNYPSSTLPASSLPSSASAYRQSSADQGNSQTRRPSSAYGHRSYASSPPSSNQYPSTPNRSLHMYQPQQPQHLSVQSISHSISHIPTSSSTGHGTGTPGF